MNRPAALVAYLLNLGAVLLYPPVYIRLVGVQSASSMGASYVYIAMLSVFGMVLAPYLEVAAFNAPKGGYWKEVSQLIHRHISIPFIGGYGLSLLSIPPAAFIFGLGGGSSGFETVYDPVLFGYLLFVFSASMITILANRKPKAEQAPAPPAQGGP